MSEKLLKINNLHSKVEDKRNIKRFRFRNKQRGGPCNYGT